VLIRLFVSDILRIIVTQWLTACYNWLSVKMYGKHIS
jgi:hypothetical protein